MRNFVIQLEEKRLEKICKIEDYQWLHERYRIFPQIFENRGHNKILDTSAGVGVVGKRIQENYDAEIICNDISPKCLEIMADQKLKTVSFDLDNARKEYPFSDNSFDAVISLATIEHLIHIDHFIKETERILRHQGYLYISTPNYSGLLYMLPFVLTGKSFHNPVRDPSRYEFYAHFRYFTYKTLLEYVSNFGFYAETVYLPIPKSSSKYMALKHKSRIKAFMFKHIMKTLYILLSPRWASEPVICFSKKNRYEMKKINKRIL
jgi:2-polyprenyl-3-methyl-5-hydroxy-6-metoxy-1,4-benzoquinol methylase